MKFLLLLHVVQSPYIIRLSCVHNLIIIIIIIILQDFRGYRQRILSRILFPVCFR